MDFPHHPYYPSRQGLGFIPASERENYEVHPNQALLAATDRSHATFNDGIDRHIDFLNRQIQNLQGAARIQERLHQHAVDVLEEDHQEAVWIQTLNQQAREEQLYAENERLENELRAEIDRLEKELRAPDRADSWRWWTRGALVALLVAGYTTCLVEMYHRRSVQVFLTLGGDEPSLSRLPSALCNVADRRYTSAIN
jgi:hypothetical protein